MPFVFENEGVPFPKRCPSFFQGTSERTEKGRDSQTQKSPIFLDEMGDFCIFILGAAQS